MGIEMSEGSNKTPQRTPREDWERDRDCIRRYEVAADIDGDTVSIHREGNVISFHEPNDTGFKSPKFKFILRDEKDAELFCEKIARVGDPLATTFPQALATIRTLFRRFTELKGRAWERVGIPVVDARVIEAFTTWRDERFTYADEEVEALGTIALFTLMLMARKLQQGGGG